MPHLEIFSYVDPDALEPSESVKRAMKLPVHISAWKLMKLDSNEAMRASAKARASSSFLRPINSPMENDSDHVRSSRNTSGLSPDFYPVPKLSPLPDIHLTPEFRMSSDFYEMPNFRLSSCSSSNFYPSSDF
ncbi:putative S-acyltransferase [Dendrobium catenatum]|uniref:Putative S-acyltransferase n=1 Tax=Dendrobium catenatum TaxID=906689 RepID=A0A2I0WB01_9ASPA|nr:putative S-acyltransferase [Dendrobium catenatum]